METGKVHTDAASSIMEAQTKVYRQKMKNRYTT